MITLVGMTFVSVEIFPSSCTMKFEWSDQSGCVSVSTDQDFIVGDNEFSSFQMMDIFKNCLGRVVIFSKFEEYSGFSIGFDGVVISVSGKYDDYPAYLISSL